LVVDPELLRIIQIVIGAIPKDLFKEKLFLEAEGGVMLFPFQILTSLLILTQQKN
jgi:hypothetical protein